MPKADLPPIVKALLRPSAYSHPVDRIDLVQTHVSYVLLAGEHVYKIKKPVDFGFLDFSTLGKRRYYCRQEVRLNSRLCSGTYVGVVGIRQDGDRVSVGGRGRVVEYAVHMRRLPENRMMDRLLEEDAVSSDMLARLADRLVEFHGKAETSQRIAEYGDWAIRYAWDENIEQWAPYVGETLSAKQDRILSAYGEAFSARMAEALRRRVEEMRIRDCHGDLRSDAVCFEDGICIYDCIDFNRRLRYTDVAGDVGFLAMDLDYRGRPDLADEFVERYVEASGDGDLRAIIDYYKCYRACVRGKVEGFRTSQPEVPVSERRAAKRAARRYFALACRYAASMPPAVLVITCGLTGTGKSTLVRRLAEKEGFEVLSSDVLRKRLAGLESSEHQYEPFQRGIYAEAFTDRDSTYDALLAEAGRALGEGRSVIVDASFVRRAYRKKAARLARERGAQFVCLLFEADVDTIKRRLARRLREGTDASDGRMLVYRGQRRTFQRPSEVPEERLVALDSTKRVSSQLRVVREAIRRLSPLSWPG